MFLHIRQSRGEILMTDRRYEFIVDGADIDYAIYWIYASDLKVALLKICDYFGVSELHKRALRSLGIEDAIDLVNEWLEYKIVNIHELGNVFYNDAYSNITEIK